MNRKLLIASLSIVALVLLAGAAYQGVNDQPYTTLRAISATDDTGPTATDANATAANALITALTAVKVREGYNPLGARSEKRGTVLITFSITNATDEIANWALYGIRREDCPLEFIAHGTATAGATETDDGGSTFYADEIVITQQSWNKTVSVVNGYQFNLGTGAVASGGIAKLVLDSCEYKYLVMKMSKSTCATSGSQFTTFY